MMKDEIKIVSKSDGLVLDTLVVSSTKRKGVVVLSHGMVEHKERYLPFMEYLAQCGYISCIHDHRGHGESVLDDGDLGYFYDESGDHIVDDLRDVINEMKERYDGLPIYLFGHSMGSLVARCYISKYGDKIDKSIICGTPCKNVLASLGIKLCDLISFFKGDRYRSAFITELALGRYDKAFAGELKNRWISKNEDNVISFNDHPKDGFTFTLNAYRNLFTLLKNTYDKRQNVKNSELPILFIAGSDDPVIGGLKKWQDSMMFMSKLGYCDIHSVYYKGMRHEILNEDDHIKVYEDIVAFLEDRPISNVK